MKNRSFAALLLSGLLLAAVTLGVSACARPIYYYPQYNNAGRPTPPSGLLNRVLVAYSGNSSSSGSLEILDALNDLRGNIPNTIKFYAISGFSAGQPTTIINYPEQQMGYVLSAVDGSLTAINYSKEIASGAVGSFGANAPSAAAATDGSRIIGAAEQSGQLVMVTSAGTFAFSLPNVYKVAINTGNSVVLAMVRNSNTLYRVVQIPLTNNPVLPPGAVDCQPLLIPQYCVVPVAGSYDRPSNVSFSIDGTNVYVLNSGPELGGTTASITVLQQGPLNINLVPTVNPLSAPAPYATLPVANPIPIPGGVTAALSDGQTLYLSGQRLMANGLFAGNLTLLNLTTYVPSASISISDGSHSKMLFADDNTLWIGSQQCSNGVRAATAASELAATGTTDQAGNTNCLTMVQLGSATPTATIVPKVVQSTTNASAALQVAYPNTNQNLYYYGSLTGLCWPQGLHKVYTAYGGQIHAFYTGGAITNTYEPGYGTTPAAGSELNNFNITVQGTVNDVAFMDANTNTAN